MRTVRFRPDTGGVETLRERRIGAIRLASGPDDSPGPEAVAAALLEGVRAGGLNLLPCSEGARPLRVRAVFAGREELRIGRASCRERVCQSVYNPWVAV